VIFGYGHMPVGGRCRLRLNNKEVIPSVIDTRSVETGLLLEFVLPPAVDTQHGFLKVLHLDCIFCALGVPTTRKRAVISVGLKTVISCVFIVSERVGSKPNLPVAQPSFVVGMVKVKFE
jgi:hypothetical protein